ncbi:hypothetical protein EDB86DRAFT_3087271 [Lactarius hatsudake]|nr:hypothetical protein EDB86DRAFT_3087271 [Lactarius hatsudake]
MTSKLKTWEAAECRRVVPRFHDEMLFCGNKDEVKGWMYDKSAQLGRRRGAGAGAGATAAQSRPHSHPILNVLNSRELALCTTRGTMLDTHSRSLYCDDYDDDDTSMDDDLMTIERDRQSFPSNALMRIYALLLVRFLPASIRTTSPAQFNARFNTDSIHDIITLEAALTRSSEVEGSQEEKVHKGSERVSFSLLPECLCTHETWFCNAVRTRYLLPIVFPAGRAHGETESHLLLIPPSSSSKILELSIFN